MGYTCDDMGAMPNPHLATDLFSFTMFTASSKYDEPRMLSFTPPPAGIRP